MSTYPNINSKPELLNTKTRDDEIIKLKYQTEEHDRKNTLKSLNNDNE